MSLDIWTQCGGLNNVLAIAISAWRVVEAQHLISTRRLVDTREEQKLLEDIVDEVKPPVPTGAGFEGLHYLLFTPFRHPPLKHGSRFGSPAERSIWYGAERIETSLAEKAYYQLVFASGTKADLKNMSCLWSAFQASIQTDRGIDLTSAAFAEYQLEISSPSGYAATQPIGKSMRSAGVDAFFFTSARCPKKGKAIGLFAPVFSNPTPGPFQTWQCGITGEGCEVVQVNTARPTVFVFKRSDFEVGGSLPQPCLAA